MDDVIADAAEQLIDAWFAAEEYLADPDSFGERLVVVRDAYLHYRSMLTEDAIKRFAATDCPTVRVVGMSRCNSAHEALEHFSAALLGGMVMKVRGGGPVVVDWIAELGEEHAELAIEAFREQPDFEDALFDLRALIRKESARASVTTPHVVSAGRSPEAGNGEVVEPHEQGSIPPEYRENEKKNGEPLTAPYLESNPQWDLPSHYLSRHYSADGTKRLTKRIKVGRAYAYMFEEVAALRRLKNESENDGH